jgi:hypothetical protein
MRGPNRPKPLVLVRAEPHCTRTTDDIPSPRSALSAPSEPASPMPSTPLSATFPPTIQAGHHRARARAATVSGPSAPFAPFGTLDVCALSAAHAPYALLAAQANCFDAADGLGDAHAGSGELVQNFIDMPLTKVHHRTRAASQSLGDFSAPLFHDDVWAGMEPQPWMSGLVPGSGYR